MNDASTPPPRGLILIVDAQLDIRAATALLLRAEGYTTLEAATGDEALAILVERDVDVMLTDLRIEPMDGLTLLQRARGVRPWLQVIIMTAYGSIESAVEALRLGAYDYITGPFHQSELCNRVERALDRRKLQLVVAAFASEFNPPPRLSALVGHSPASRELISRMVRVAQSDATVLIQGESGTGKMLVAHTLHAHSRRSSHPFIHVHCTAFSETLLESLLFGQDSSKARTKTKALSSLFEKASGGTLFINEVAEMSSTLQARLARALQDGGEARRMDVRVIAATYRDIEQELREGRFRQELYYLLNVAMLRAPPLRERLEDVPELAKHFLERINSRSSRPKYLSEEAVERLKGYDFPGNVRELESLVERAAAQADGDTLRPEDFFGFIEEQ